MELKKLQFIAPRDISKGESFSFEELFNSDENMEALMLANATLIDDLSNKKLSVLESSLKEKYQEKENEMRAHLLNREKELEATNEKVVASAVEIAEAKIKSALEVEKTKVQMLEKSEQEKQQTINSLKEVYNELASVEIEKIREKLTKEKEDLIREYEDKAKSATTIGENAEEEIRMTLRNLFPNDIIEKPNHALGEADVLHTITNGGKDVARVYYEIKNRKNWSKSDYENFADKVRKEDHEFNIYIAQALPKVSKDQNITQFSEGMFYDEVNNIYLTSFENWLPVIAVIRKQAIELMQAKANSESINDIKDRVYVFFKSPEFNNYLNRLKKNFEEIDNVFKAIQKSTVDGKTIKERAVLELSNLEAEINSKLNA